MQSNVVAAQLLERLGARCRRAMISHVVARQQLPDALALALVVLDDQHAAHALRDLASSRCEAPRSSCSRLTGLSA